MNKTYLSIIVVLILMILAVASFAFYKANLSSTVISDNVPVTSTPPPSEKPNGQTVNQNQQDIPLTITAPANGTIVRSPKVTVVGKTVAGADVAINDLEVVADTMGSFTATLTLDEGENYIYVAASDQDGNFSEQEILVIYEPLQP